MYVVTEAGMPVYEGSKTKCKEYIKQAIQKGSNPGFLKIVDKL